MWSQDIAIPIHCPPNYKSVYRKHHAEQTRAHNESVEIVLNPYPKVPSSVNSIYIVNILYRL